MSERIYNNEKCSCGHWNVDHEGVQELRKLNSGKCYRCNCPGCLYTTPRHLSDKITDKAWTYIVLLSCAWCDEYWRSDRPMTRFEHRDNQVKDWLILNWWVAYLCNPNVQNKQHLTMWALEYKLTSNLRLIEALGEAKALNRRQYEKV